MIVTFKNNNDNNINCEKLTIEFQPRNSIFDKDSKSGILIFTMHYIETTSNNEFDKQVATIEKSFTIKPIKYNNKNTKLITDIFEFVEKAANTSINFNEDVQFKIDFTYEDIYNIMLKYVDGEVTIIIKRNDYDDSIISYVLDYDFEIKELYQFFNVVMYFIKHKEEEIGTAFLNMDYSWKNINLSRINL